MDIVNYVFKNENTWGAEIIGILCSFLITTMIQTLPNMYEEFRLLVCNVVWFLQDSTFRRTVEPPSRWWQFDSISSQCALVAS
jgi:hypothetical protein